jgi:hypothetical protein
MRIILAQLEPRTDQTVATGTIDEVSSAKSAPAALNGNSIRVERDIVNLSALPDAAAAFGRMVQQQFVEHRTFNLISRWRLAAKDVAEQKASAATATGRNNFASVFYDDIGLIEFLFDPHALKGGNAAWQERFADFETRRFLLFENGHVPTLLCQESARSAPRRPAAYDNDVEELRHGETQAFLPSQPRSWTLSAGKLGQLGGSFRWAEGSLDGLRGTQESGVAGVTGALRISLVGLEGAGVG